MERVRNVALCNSHRRGGLRRLAEKVSISHSIVWPTEIALLLDGLAGERRHRGDPENGGGGDGQRSNAELLLQQRRAASAHASCDEKALGGSGELYAVGRGQEGADAEGSAVGTDGREEESGRKGGGAKGLWVRWRRGADGAVEVRDQDGAALGEGEEGEGGGVGAGAEADECVVDDGFSSFTWAGAAID